MHLEASRYDNELYFLDEAMKLKRIEGDLTMPSTYY